MFERLASREQFAAGVHDSRTQSPTRQRDGVDPPGMQERQNTLVAQNERMSENINRAMQELTELGGVHPHLLADDTIEVRPAPASPELSQKVAEIFARAGVQELRPWIWGVAEADNLSRL